MEAILNSPIFWAMLFILVSLTNVLTQLFKKLTWDKIPTNWLVPIIAVVLSEAAIFVYCQLASTIYLASHAVIGAVLGLLVAYGAMFGYDKLKEALEDFKKLQSNK